MTSSLAFKGISRESAIAGLVDVITRSCAEADLPPAHGFFATPIPGLTFFRSSAIADPRSAAPGSVDEGPAVCVVLQGTKRAKCASREIRYEPETYSISPVELPLTDILVEASEEHPFLGLRLRLDAVVLTDLLLELPPPGEDSRPSPGLTPTPLHDDLIDPLIRLVDALRDPHDVAVLGAQVQREITYRLIRGPQHALLRQIATPDSQLSRIKLAVDWIREHYAGPFSIESAAAVAHMSTSSFHAHFKAVTSMSPLQYQKHLRLHEARRLLLDRQADTTTVSFMVGYNSPSQFSRDYKRLFGEPPMRDVRKLQSAV
ncbi:AraC family transcriptional regulator [Streptomyces sp. NPDC026672]|uniref:AraC family transcriptional regulator n=1 Tax=unclassified Streptomyces TaxID=2593676 RepID=UPI0033E66E79